MCPFVDMDGNPVDQLGRKCGEYRRHGFPYSSNDTMDVIQTLTAPSTEGKTTLSDKISADKSFGIS